MAKDKGTRKRGFSISSYLLGILTCFLIIIGLLGGSVAFLLFGDLDSVLGIVGLENRDADGNYVYINTDEANGADSLLGLVTKLTTMGAQYQTLTLGELETLLPAMSGLSEQLATELGRYTPVDKEALRELPFGQLGTWVQNTIQETRIPALLESAGIAGGLQSNPLTAALLYGVEASYVELDTGKTPVYFDLYEQQGDSYIRKDDGHVLPSALADSLCKKGLSTWQLFFYQNSGAWFVTVKDAETGLFPHASASNDPLYTLHYSAEQATLTGNYYMSGDVRVDENPVTIRSIAESPLGNLDYVPVTALFAGSATDPLITDLLGGHTVGALMDGTVNFTEEAKEIELNSLSVKVKPTDTMMLSLFYRGVVNMHEDPATPGKWVCSYKDDEGTLLSEHCEVNLDAEGNIASIWREDPTLGRVEVKGTTVGDMSTLIAELTVTELLGAVDPTDAVMMYLCFGVTDTNTDTMTATYKTETETLTAHIEVGENGKVTRVYYEDATGTESSTAVRVTDISTKVSGLQNDLPVADLVDVAPDGAVLLYLGYGVTGAYEEAGVWYGNYDAEGSKRRCELILSEREGAMVVTGAKDAETGEMLARTTIGGISAAVNGVQEELALSDLMTVTAEDEILAYLAFGITELEPTADPQILTATHYSLPEGEEPVATETVEVKTDEANKIISVKRLDGTLIEGTTIAGISTRIDRLTHDMTLGDVMEIAPDDALMQKLADSKLNEISADINTKLTLDDFTTVGPDDTLLLYLVFEARRPVESAGTLGEITYSHIAEGRNGEPLYLVTEGDPAEIIGIYREEAGAPVAVTGAKIDEVSTRIESLRTELTIGELVDIDPDDKLMQKLKDKKLDEVSGAITDELTLDDFITVAASDKVLLYMTYGAKNVTPVTDLPYQYTAVNEANEPLFIVTELQGDPEKEVVVGVFTDSTLETPYAAATIHTVTERTDSIRNDLTIGELVDIDPDDKLMQKLKDKKLGEVSGAISDELTLDDFITVAATDNILMYLTYGARGITPVTGKPYQYTATEEHGNPLYIKTEPQGDPAKDVVVGVFTDSTLETPYAAATVNRVTERTDSIRDDLTLGELITVSPDDKLMQKLKDKKLNEVSDALSAELTLDDFIEVTATDNILMYITYGVRTIAPVTGKAYQYTAINEEGDTVYIKTVLTGTPEQETVMGVYKDSALTQPQTAATVKDVTKRTQTIRDDLTLGEFIEIGPDDKILGHLAGSHISELDRDITNLSVNELFAKDIYKHGGEPVLQKAVAGAPGAGEIQFDPSFIYYTKTAEGTTVLTGDQGHLDALPAEPVYTYGAPHSVWRLLLYRDGREVCYGINSMTALIDNMQTNIYTTTLSELVEAEIIVLAEGSTLLTKRPLPMSKTFGEMTLKEVIEFIDALPSA